MAGGGVFDSDETYDHFFAVSDRIYVIVEAAVWCRFSEFTAPARAALAAGELTTPAGGGGTSQGGGVHRHQMTDFGGSTDPPAVWSRHFARDSDGGAAAGFITGLNPNADLWTFGAAASHTHPTPAHQHTVPTHAHDLDYGIFKEAMPASIDVNIGLWKKPFEGGSWELLGSISGVDQEEQLVDIVSWFNDPDTGGLYRLTFQSAPGQPNNGRLRVDVAGMVLGAIKSA